MSEIPFITELGANLDRAVRASMSARRPLRRRWFMLSAATVLIVGSAAVATQLFTSDDEVAATTNILCEQVDSVISPGALSPVEACTAEATREGVTVSTNDLVACQPPRMAVTVVLGGPAECERRGWRSLGAGYATIRGNVTKLTAAVTATHEASLLAASTPTGASVASVGDVAAGKRQYDVWCIACHSAGGAGPDLLSAGSVGSSVTLESMTTLIRDGENHPPGAYKETEISDTQLADITAYILSSPGS